MGGSDREFRIDMYTSVYLKWITNKNLLYSTGSSNQCSVETWMGGELRESIGEGNGNPLQYSCLENPRDWGACWAAVYGVTQSRTRLTQLSSSCLGPVSCFHILVFLRTYCREWVLDGRYSFLSWVSSGLTSSHWRAAVTDGCVILVYCHGRKYSISQHVTKKFSIETIPLTLPKFNLWAFNIHLQFPLCLFRFWSLNPRNYQINLPTASQPVMGKSRAWSRFWLS